MIVTICFSIIPAGAIAEINLEHQPGGFQVTQRVIDGCIADCGQTETCRFENLAGCRVILSFLYDLKYRFPLGRKLCNRVAVSLWHFQDGFRLILNLKKVKRTRWALVFGLWTSVTTKDVASHTR